MQNLGCSVQRSWLSAVILILFFLIGCGGGGGGSVPTTPSAPTTPTTPATPSTPASPAPSVPSFATTPPSTAAEAIPYVYSVSATDTAGSAVTLQLVSAPVGALLSGNQLTWTPTATQARKPNDFIIKASNASNSATQAWTVTPAGTVSGISGWSFLADSTEDWVPQDLTTTTLAAHISDGSGGYTKIAGVGRSDGQFSITNVPGGPFWLQIGTNFIWTDRSSVSLIAEMRGRADRDYSYGSLSFHLTGLNSWQSSDMVNFFVSNVDTFLDPPLAGAVGVTELNVVSSFAPLLSASKGDQYYVYQRSLQTFAGKLVSYIAKASGPTPITMLQGQTTDVTDTLSDPPQHSLRLNFKNSAFTAMVPFINPTAQEVSKTVWLFAMPSGAAHGAIGNGAPLMTMPPAANDEDLGDFQYGNPFPDSWTPALRYRRTASVPYLLPGATSPFSQHTDLLAWITDLPTSTAAVQPLVGPVVNAKINATDFFANQSAAGLTPTLSWEAPPVGTAHYYSICINRLVLAGGGTWATGEWCFLTAEKSFTLPPGLLASGESYYFFITAVYQPGFDPGTPGKRQIPMGSADVLSGIIQP
jgi:hypothetical protein